VIPAAAITDRGYSRMRWIGQIFWLLAYDACAAPHLLPAFTVSANSLASDRDALQIPA